MSYPYREIHPRYVVSAEGERLTYTTPSEEAAFAFAAAWRWKKGARTRVDKYTRLSDIPRHTLCRE